MIFGPSGVVLVLGIWQANYLRSTKDLQFYSNNQFVTGQLIIGQVLSFADRDQEDRIDPMVYIFPRWPSLSLFKLSAISKTHQN